MRPDDQRFAWAPFGVTVALALGFGAAAPRRALAEQHATAAAELQVLALMTDDADDQADALSHALRARVAAMPAWSLGEANVSFETLAIALHCPTKPDTGCLERIAGQLHVEHFIWGTMSHARSGSEVTVDLHLWSHGAREARAVMTFPYNLKDAHSPKLRMIATHLIDLLSADTVQTVFEVHAGTGGGHVFVDGAEAATLSGGTALITVAPGPHAVGVKVAGYAAPEQTVDTSSTAPREVTFALTPHDSASADSASGGLDPRKALGYSAVGAGAILVVAGIVEGAGWISDARKSSEERSLVPNNVTDVCNPPMPSSAAAIACSTTRRESTEAALAWVFTFAGAGLAATGTWLLLTPGSQGAAHGQASLWPKVEIEPPGATRRGFVKLTFAF
jgi:hypothetical protein